VTATRINDDERGRAPSHADQLHLALRDTSHESEQYVLDPRDGLVEEMRDVVVVKVADNVAAPAAANHESKMAKQPQLVANRGGLHPHRHREFVHARGAHRSRLRIRTRLGVATACIASATTPAKSRSSRSAPSMSHPLMRRRHQAPIAHSAIAATPSKAIEVPLVMYRSHCLEPRASHDEIYGPGVAVSERIDKRTRNALLLEGLERYVGEHRLVVD
jgi:hypothetical protein